MVKGINALPIHLSALNLRMLLQNAGHEGEEATAVVCDVNSEKE